MAIAAEIPTQESTDVSQDPAPGTNPAGPSQPPTASQDPAKDSAEAQTDEALAEALQGEEDEAEPAAPTTRSKTAPFRKVPTPPVSPRSTEIKRGVITLSDVAAARAVLAEKANAHWAKGLGGGQNKESETIVNFLYKMKVGPGESEAMS
jgi:hypothetical protein